MIKEEKECKEKKGRGTLPSIIYLLFAPCIPFFLTLIKISLYFCTPVYLFLLKTGEVNNIC